MAAASVPIVSTRGQSPRGGQRGRGRYQSQPRERHDEETGTVGVVGSPAAAGPVAQPYDFYLVLDFEATCDDTTRLQPQEVIEFPVVCVCATTRQIVWEVHSYVKPVHHPILTPFCTSLTGITQATVDAGVSFPVALAAVESKLLEVGLLPQTAGSPRFIFVTCGDWDLRSMLPRQLSVSSLPQPSYYKSWINIKIPFAQYFKLKGRGPGMDGMLQKLNLPLVGRHHSGIDDCRNIASILLTLMARGVCLTATTAPGV